MYTDFPPKFCNIHVGWFSFINKIWRIMLFRQHRRGPGWRSRILIVVCFLPFSCLLQRPPDNCIYRPNPPNYISRHMLMPTRRVQDAVVPTSFPQAKQNMVWAISQSRELSTLMRCNFGVWHCNCVCMGENTRWCMHKRPVLSTPFIVPFQPHHLCHTHNLP